MLQWGAANDESKERSLDYTLVEQRARWCFYALNTLGDPALTIKLSSPRGSLALDQPHYNPGDEVVVLLMDSDVNSVTRATSAGSERT